MRRPKEKTEKGKEKEEAMSHVKDMNCWIAFVLYAVTGRMREADIIMREHGASVRRHAKKQRILMPFKAKPIFRGMLFDNGRSISSNSLDGVIAKPAPCPDGSDIVIGEDGCVDHAIEPMSFVSHSEDLECAQWFASPQAAISEFVVALRPHIRGYTIRLKRPPACVLWHHSWTDARIQGESPIPLSVAAMRHPHICEFADQFRWNARTQSEVITEPTSERYKLEPVGDVDVKALDLKFCHPAFWQNKVPGPT